MRPRRRTGAPDALLPGATGVLIVGSVITAGDARTLLLPGRAEDPGLRAEQPLAGRLPEPGHRTRRAGIRRPGRAVRPERGTR